MQLAVHQGTRRARGRGVLPPLRNFRAQLLSRPAQEARDTLSSASRVVQIKGELQARGLHLPVALALVKAEVEVFDWNLR